MRAKTHIRTYEVGNRSRHGFDMLAVLALLLAAAALLLWRGVVINEELATRQDRLVREVVKGAAESITSRVRLLRKSVALLVSENAASIRKLAAHPGNEELYKALSAEIRQAFPRSFTFTLTNSAGRPLLGDFDGSFDEACQEEIRRYTLGTRVPGSTLHPEPSGCHFDIVQPVTLGNGRPGVFFVGFLAESIADALADHELPGYDLLLTSHTVPDLIELTAEDTEDVSPRLTRLSAEEQNRVVRRLPVAGTQWDVVALRQARVLSSPHPSPWRQTIWAMGILGVMAFAALLVIDRSREAVIAALSGLDAQRKRLRAIFDTLGEAVVTTDDRGVIQAFNPAAERIFGYAASEASGQNVRILLPEPYRSEHDGYLDHYLRTGESRIIGHPHEVVGLRKDGSVFPVELTVNDSLVGGERLFTAAIRDITERKEIDRMKNEFISLVSHELRTPLTSIRGSLGLIAGGAAGEISIQARKLIEIASSSSERLVRLINDILDIEKIESGKMHLEMRPQQLLPLIEKAVEASNGLATQQGITIELAADLADARAAMDADRITQVLMNLISNAVKFSTAGSKVRISTDRAQTRIRVSVTDAGPGIREELRDRIFEKFAQADAPDTRQISGSGLGLSICRAIVQKHGGEIGFDSEPGNGSTFFFELPLSGSTSSYST